MVGTAMFSDSGKVLSALLLSLMLHGLVYSIWPNLQPSSSKLILVQGELIPPEVQDTPPVIESPPPPELKPEPVSMPEMPRPTRQEPAPEPKQIPDTGVALPLIAEKADDAAAGDYVVQDAPALNPRDNLPFASRPGTTPLEQYTPPSSGTVTGAGSEEDPVDRDVLAEYGRGLRERALQFGGYPPLAQKRGWQGRVKVLVRFARNGLPQQVGVKESSGHRVLDDQAMEMVRQACKDFPLPDALSGKAFSVVVPVDFKLV
jgi:periplasmic protein TonB